MQRRRWSRDPEDEPRSLSYKPRRTQAPKPPPRAQGLPQPRFHRINPHCVAGRSVKPLLPHFRDPRAESRRPGARLPSPSGLVPLCSPAASVLPPLKTQRSRERTAEPTRRSHCNNSVRCRKTLPVVKKQINRQRDRNLLPLSSSPTSLSKLVKDFQHLWPGPRSVAPLETSLF